MLSTAARLGHAELGKRGSELPRASHENLSRWSWPRLAAHGGCADRRSPTTAIPLAERVSLLAGLGWCLVVMRQRLVKTCQLVGHFHGSNHNRYAAV
jgi:hypothetical protein